MKKRLLALTLVLALALSIAIPGFAAGETFYGSDFSQWKVIGASGTSIASSTSVASVTSIDSTLRIAAAVGDSYAVVKSADGTKISWKQLAQKDIGLDGKMDVTKLLKVKDESYLLFFAGDKTAAAAVATNTSYLKGATLDDKISGILIPAASTWKVDSAGKKPTYFVDDNDEQMAKFATPSSINLEYAPINSTNWEPFDGLIPVMPYKQDFNVREAATATKAPSPASKITVAALTAVPNVKFDATKGVAKFKKDMEYSIEGGAIVTTTGAVTLSVGDKYKYTSWSGREVEATITADTWISYRMAATDKKPGSDWAGSDFTGNLREAVWLNEDMFCITAKGLEVVGSIPVQVYADSKWKNTKVFKAADLTGATAASPKTFTVRMAGSKLSAPGDTLELTYSGGGNFSVDYPRPATPTT